MFLMTCHSGNYHSIYYVGSGSYSEAVRDVKTMFPEGLCCKINVDLQAEQVSDDIPSH